MTSVSAKIWLCLGLLASPAVAQTVAQTPEQKAATIIDESPLLSPRAAAMGGALSPFADDLDAAYANPAGIGGMRLGKNMPWIRKLYFPWFGVAANANSQDLYGEFKEQGGTNDSAIGAAIIDANAGKRQYARVNALSGAVLGRTMIVPFTDHQVAAVGRGEGSNQIDLRYRTMSGVTYGFSAQDNDERFAVGYSGTYASRKETTGTFLYDDMIDKAARSQAISDNSVDYGSAVSHTVGMRWRLAKTGAPTLAIVAHDVGGTRYTASKAAADGSSQNLEFDQDLTVGFGLAPQIGKWSQLSFVLEAARLTEEDTSMAKKFRTGVEWAFFGSGSYAPLALRAGYNEAGASYGLAVNLGLIGFEASATSVDIGVGNEKVLERRSMGTLYVNVADY